MQSTAKLPFIVVNLVGGLLVLGSYAYGLAAADPDAAGAGIWGGVPEGLRPAYTANMLLAASGYFLFTQHILRSNAATARVGARGFGVFTAIYAAIMLPSALWLPLTNLMLASPSTVLWVTICGVLAIVGIAALALALALLRLEPHPGETSRTLALIGVAPFVLQTAVLDAILWPLFFPL